MLQNIFCLYFVFHHYFFLYTSLHYLCLYLFHLYIFLPTRLCFMLIYLAFFLQFKSFSFSFKTVHFRLLIFIIFLSLSFIFLPFFYISFNVFYIKKFNAVYLFFCFKIFSNFKIVDFLCCQFFFFQFPFLGNKLFFSFSFFIITLIVVLYNIDPYFFNFISTFTNFL